jgi:hypothetical protein
MHNNRARRFFRLNFASLTEKFTPFPTPFQQML